MIVPGPAFRADTRYLHFPRAYLTARFAACVSMHQIYSGLCYEFVSVQNCALWASLIREEIPASRVSASGKASAWLNERYRSIKSMNLDIRTLGQMITPDPFSLGHGATGSRGVADLRRATLARFSDQGRLAMALVRWLSAAGVRRRACRDDFRSYRLLPTMIILTFHVAVGRHSNHSTVFAWSPAVLLEPYWSRPGGFAERHELDAVGLVVDCSDVSC